MGALHGPPHLMHYPLLLWLALCICTGCSCLVVGAPSKISSDSGLKAGATVVIIPHHPAPHTILATHVVAHEHPSVSTSSIQTVHRTVPSVTHTVTQIAHPVEEASHVHAHAVPHPASTVNGHSLGYGTSCIHVYKSYVAPHVSHESMYTVHVGGFGVGLHVGGHGHGHGYFAVI